MKGPVFSQFLYRCIRKLSSYFSVDNRGEGDTIKTVPANALLLFHYKRIKSFSFYSHCNPAAALLVALSFPYKSYRWILHSSSSLSPRRLFHILQKKDKGMHKVRSALNLGPSLINENMSPWNMMKNIC